jgi:hypothetical protein
LAIISAVSIMSHHECVVIVLSSSGTGRGIFAACMLHPFDIALGIELLPSLHDAAVLTRSDFRLRLTDPQFIPRVSSPRRPGAGSGTGAHGSGSGGDASSSSSSPSSSDSSAEDVAPAINYEQTTDIQLICGDFLSVDWSHADVV